MMNTKKKGGLIWRSYLKEKFRLILGYLFMAAVFYIVSFLYGYEEISQNMFYALELALFFGTVFLVWDFFGYYRKCQALMLALQREEEKSEAFPEAETLPERLYRQAVEDSEREKRKLLTEYDKKKRDMADYYTMWIHQIKTPIAAMRLLLQEDDGSGEFASKGEESAGEPGENDGTGAGRPGRERQREREELFKIERYAEMALYFARLDSLSSDLLFKSCEVSDIVKQAVKKYSVLFLRSGLSFRMEEFELRAVTDEKWLCFVVEQVFSNALKYTRKGGIAIYGADAEGNMREGRTSCFVIEDTGIGIKKSDLPRIFERGFTGYNGRMDRKSTGIGLYLCDQIMGRLSHTIRVKSGPGKGTKVILGFLQETVSG